LVGAPKGVVIWGIYHLYLEKALIYCLGYRYVARAVSLQQEAGKRTGRE
jgi:hypothetical protein